MLAAEVISLFFFIILRHPPSSTLFPYTTLFRSIPQAVIDVAGPGDERRREQGQHAPEPAVADVDRKSTRLNSSHITISYAVFCLKKKTTKTSAPPTLLHSYTPLSIHTRRLRSKR